MTKVLLAEFRRAINIWCVLGIFGVAFSICFDSWNDLLINLENNNGYVHYFFWNSAYGGMCRNYLLPVFATFPFAASLCNERKGKAVAYIVSREGRKRYGFAKYFVNAVSGGAVVAIGTALVLGVLLIQFPMTNSEFQDVQVADLFHDWAAVHRPMEYCMVQIGLGFFRGIIWSSIALLISVYIQDPFVVTVSPYVGNYAFVHMSRLMQFDDRYRFDMILLGRSVIRSSLNTVAIAFIGTMSIAIIVGIVFVRKMARRLGDGSIH